MGIARTISAVRVYNLIEETSFVKGFFGIFIKDG